MTEKSIKIIGVNIDRILMKEAVDIIDGFIRSRRVHYIVTPNPEIVMRADTDEEYRTILNNADLSLPDGIGIIWAGKILEHHLNVNNRFLRAIYYFFYIILNLFSIIIRPKKIYSTFPERVTGADLVWELARLASENKYSIYFLGGMPGVADKAAKKLKLLYPNLKIAGTYAGYPGENSLPDRIRITRPDILLVAFGSPKQEVFIAENLLKLATPIAVGVGGAFDFVAGKIARAPKIMRNLGLEWLWRFKQEPKRARRIYNAFIKFPIEVLKWKVKGS